VGGRAHVGIIGHGLRVVKAGLRWHMPGRVRAG
jgi:hypothetical protein